MDTPSLTTTRNRPSGLAATAYGLSPNVVCSPAGVTCHPTGVNDVPSGCGPACTPGGAAAATPAANATINAATATPDPVPIRRRATIRSSDLSDLGNDSDPNHPAPNTDTASS